MFYINRKKNPSEFQREFKKKYKMLIIIFNRQNNLGENVFYRQWFEK